MTPGRHMETEMREQPAVLAALVDRRAELAEAIRAVRPEPLAGIVLVARGSSDHAALLGRYLLEPAAGRPVSLAAPSLHTLYGARVDCSGYLAIAVSQSGRTPEIAAVLDRLAADGARTLAITNEPDSPLADAADATVALGAGEEQAVPATKTFTAQAAAFAIVAEALGDVGWGDEGWAALPGAVAEVLDDLGSAERVAEAIGDASGLLATARGYAYPMALEAALKLKESTGLLAEGYSTADLRHGPTAVVSAGFPVLGLSLAGPAASDTRGLLEDFRGRGAQVHVIGDEKGDALALPAGLPEALATLPAVVRAQQVALALARVRGLDPDAPAGLTKVTPTY